ncbi:protein of unknown function [Ralstonia solanacearum CFBP2957]|nr:protein of unknown function [Ralstonia solanacearum CFBP2957]
MGFRDMVAGSCPEPNRAVEPNSNGTGHISKRWGPLQSGWANRWIVGVTAMRMALGFVAEQRVHHVTFKPPRRSYT